VSRFLNIAIGALAVGLVTGYVLDWHRHTCDACGHNWGHLGALNLGSEPAHTCPRCGQLQWWKCGVPAEIRAMHEHPRVGRAA
jgi:predicted RNA-binding Zn-ribbon protein involved in translation (DUF1610 family)